MSQSLYCLFFLHVLNNPIISINVSSGGSNYLLFFHPHHFQLYVHIPSHLNYCNSILDVLTTSRFCRLFSNTFSPGKSNLRLFSKWKSDNLILQINFSMAFNCPQEKKRKKERPLDGTACLVYHLIPSWLSKLISCSSCMYTKY